MSIETDIYAKSVGQTANPSLTPDFSPETEALLQAALNHGGAVAQSAAEIAHPNGSFLSMAKQKLGQAFTGVMDTLALPSEAVASLMDSDLTFEEAVKKHITPSDILLKGQEAPTTLLGKIGTFGARLVIDTLLDPLTYVTFGTSSGLFGISKLAEIPLAGRTATKLGLATTTIVDEAGNVVSEAVRHRAVSAAGQVQLQKITTHLEDTLKRDTLDTFYSDTNIRGRLNSVVSKLRGKNDAEITDFLSKAHSAADAPVGAEYIVAENLLKIPKEARQSADALRAAEQFAVKDAMDQQAERMARHTISARRSAIEADAKRMMSNIIEKNVEKDGIILDKMGKPVLDQFGTRMVRDLAKEWVDAGGIKAFGYSLVAGARIRSVLSLLPGLSHVDRATGPLRHVMASLFSTSYNASGRIPDTLLQIRQGAKNAQDLKQAEVFSFVPKLYARLGITQDEDKMISTAIAADLPPTSGGDGRLETLWAMLHTQQGVDLGQQIADGKFGDDTVKLWKAANTIREQLKKNLILMHESGIAAFKQNNYIPGIMNEQKKITNPFVKFKTSKAVNAEKAELVKWRNVDKPDEVLFGTEESLALERLSKVEETNRINKEIQTAVMKNTEQRARISDSIEKLWASLADKQVKSVLRGSSRVVGEAATKDVFNQQALERVVREAIPAVDRKAILTAYATKYYEAGAKKSAAPTILSAEDVINLRQDLAAGDEELDTIAQHITSNLDKFGIKVSKATAPGTGKKVVGDDYQKKLQELIGVVMETGIKGKQQYMKEALSKDGEFQKVIQGLSEEWHKNPGGISRTMEAILGKQFELSTIMQDLSDTKNALESELKSPGLKRVADRWFYKDSKEQIYERVRATAKEINDNYFKGEEMFTESALKATLGGSLNAIRAAGSKDLLDDISKRFGVPQSAAPSDFVQLGIAGLQKEVSSLQKYVKLEDGNFAIKNAGGEQLYFHPTIAQAVNDMLKVMSEDPASSLVAKSYDKLTNIWKASVTSIFPSFHGRNAISNVFQHMMDIGYESLNPVNHIIASRLIHYNNDIEKIALRIGEGDPNAARELMDLQSRVILTDTRGHNWTVGEMVQMAKNNVIAFQPNIIGQADVMYSSKETVDFLMDDLFAPVNKWGMAKKIGRGANPASQAFVPFRAGRAVGNYIEWQGRLVDFVANLRKTGDVEHSAFQTKQFLFDYQNLTPFERTVMRRLIPFYTYSRKNLELQVKTLLTKPGRTELLRNSIQSVGDVWGNGNLSDAERASLPAWMRDSLDLVIKRNGQNLSILTTLGTPLEQPFQQLGNIMGATNPIIKGPLEAITGYSFFNGRPLSEVTNATAFSSPLVPPVIRDFIGYTEVKYTDKKTHEEKTLYVSLHPDRMNLFNNLPLTPRVLSTLKLIQTSDIPTSLKYLQFLLSMKPDTLDLGQEQARRDKELQTQLQDLLSAAGVGYSFQRFQLKK